MADRSRYVYLKEVYNYLNDYFCDRIKNGITGPVVWNDIHQALKDIPAADVKPVVRGEWIECDYVVVEHGFVEHIPKAALKCSSCHRAFKKAEISVKNYCPNCGADMRPKEADDE